MLNDEWGGAGLARGGGFDEEKEDDDPGDCGEEGEEYRKYCCAAGAGLEEESALCEDEHGKDGNQQRPNQDEKRAEKTQKVSRQWRRPGAGVDEGQEERENGKDNGNAKRDLRARSAVVRILRVFAATGENYEIEARRTPDGGAGDA